MKEPGILRGKLETGKINRLSLAEAVESNFRRPTVIDENLCVFICYVNTIDIVSEVDVTFGILKNEVFLLGYCIISFGFAAGLSGLAVHTEDVGKLEVLAAVPAGRRFTDSDESAASGDPCGNRFDYFFVLPVLSARPGAVETSGIDNDPAVFWYAVSEDIVEADESDIHRQAG